MRPRNFSGVPIDKHASWEQNMPQIRKNTLQDAKSYGIIVWLITAQEKCSGIEVVITGLTRNLLPLEPPQNLQSLVFQALNGFY